MVEAERRRLSQQYRSESLLPSPKLGRALLAGAVAAFAGAAVWGAMILYSSFQSGWVAWGIGALIGFAISKAGGHGTFLTASAAILALLAILTGKNVSYRVQISEIAEQQVTAAYHVDIMNDARDWVALGDSPTVEQVAEFVEGHGYEVPAAELADFAAGHGAFLTDVAGRSPALEDLRAEFAAEITVNYSFLDHLGETFRPFDILAAALGIASAVYLVHRGTNARIEAQERRIEREQNLAEAREAAARMAAEKDASGD